MSRIICGDEDDGYSKEVPEESIEHWSSVSDFSSDSSIGTLRTEDARRCSSTDARSWCSSSSSSSRRFDDNDGGGYESTSSAKGRSRSGGKVSSRRGRLRKARTIGLLGTWAVTALALCAMAGAALRDSYLASNRGFGRGSAVVYVSNATNSAPPSDARSLPIARRGRSHGLEGEGGGGGMCGGGRWSGAEEGCAGAVRWPCEGRWDCLRELNLRASGRLLGPPSIEAREAMGVPRLGNPLHRFRPPRRARGGGEAPIGGVWEGSAEDAEDAEAWPTEFANATGSGAVCLHLPDAGNDAGSRDEWGTIRDGTGYRWTFVCALSAVFLHLAFTPLALAMTFPSHRGRPYRVAVAVSTGTTFVAARASLWAGYCLCVFGMRFGLDDGYWTGGGGEDRWGGGGESAWGAPLEAACFMAMAILTDLFFVWPLVFG